jgi:hypothetical protein
MCTLRKWPTFPFCRDRWITPAETSSECMGAECKTAELLLQRNEPEILQYAIYFVGCQTNFVLDTSKKEQLTVFLTQDPLSPRAADEQTASKYGGQL